MMHCQSLYLSISDADDDDDDDAIPLLTPKREVAAGFRLLVDLCWPK